MKIKFYLLEIFFGFIIGIQNSLLATFPVKLTQPYLVRLSCFRSALSLFNKSILVAVFSLFFTNKVLADYTINAGSTIDPNVTTGLRDATGTILIYGTMAINADVTFTCATPLTIFVYAPNGQIRWYDNKTLAFPAGTTITYINNPGPPPGLTGTPESASKILKIGNIAYASANDNSNNVVFNFTQLNDIGGTAIVAPSTTTFAVCAGTSMNLSANPLIPPGSDFKIKWHISSNTAGFSPNYTSTAVTTALSGLESNTYTVTCELYADAGSNNFFLAASKTLSVTILPRPLVPTPVTASSYSICTGSSTNIKATSPEGNIRWYTANTGGTSIGSSSSAANFLVSPTVNTTYYSEAIINATGCVSESRTAIAIAVSPVSVGGTLPSFSACSTGSSTLALTGNVGNVSQWESSTNGGTPWTVIPITTTSLSFTAVSQTTLYRARILSGACSPAYSTAATVGLHNVWTGATSSDWNTTGNWSDNQLPSNTCPDVIIPAGTAYAPVLGSGTATINNLVIHANASLVLNGTANMQIAGKITNNGTLDVSYGTLDFNGTSPQNVSGNLFVSNTLKHLIVSNNSSIAGLTVSDSPADLFKITGAISFGNVSNSTINTGDNIVLVSTETGTARVADITNNGVNTGNKFVGKVTVERYFPSIRAWRLFTAPLSAAGSVFENWQNGGVYQPGKGTYVSGPPATNPTGANGLDWSPLNNSSLKSAVGLSSVLNTHIALLSKQLADTSDNLPYFIFVRGDRNPINTNPALSSKTTLSSKGKLQTGRQTFKVSTTALSFTMIGNPYASPVNMANIVRGNVENRFWVWDPHLNSDQGAYVMFDDPLNTGTYSATPLSTSFTTGMTQVLQSGQAFYVQTIANGPASVIFQETAKSSGYNPVAFRPLGQPPSIRANLFHLNSNNRTVLLDGTMAQFDNTFDKGVDQKDAVKPTNVKEMLGLQRDAKTLTVERRPMSADADTLFLQLTKTTQRNYRFEFIPANLDQSIAALLEDSFTGKELLLNAAAVSTHDFNITTDTKSSAPNRFRIVFKPAVAFYSVKGTVLNSDIAIEWNVAHEYNVKEYAIERSADGVSFARVGSLVSTGNSSNAVSYSWLDVTPVAGVYYYRVRNISHNDVTGYSEVVKVKINKSTPAMYVFPNPVTDNNISLQMNNMARGLYHVRLINSPGQVVFNSRISHAPGTSTESILPGSKLPPGIYRLEISAPNKAKTMVKVLVK